MSPRSLTWEIRIEPRSVKDDESIAGSRINVHAPRVIADTADEILASVVELVREETNSPREFLNGYPRWWVEIQRPSLHVLRTSRAADPAIVLGGSVRRSNRDRRVPHRANVLEEACQLAGSRCPPPQGIRRTVLAPQLAP